MSQFTLFYPKDITFSVRAMFRVCEMTALCIRSRISPPRAPNSSLIASSTSVDHPPKTSMMMLYCRMSYPGNCCLSSQRRGPYLMVFSSCFFSLFSVHGQLISTARTFFFSCMIYKSRIHSVLLYLLTYCKDWYIPICLGLG